MSASLDRALRGEMESLFGQGFRDVRIYRPAPCPRGPKAWTCGSDIYLAVPGFDPDSPEGRDILGHELAHVLQQRHGRAQRAGRPRLEAEAAAARRVARGQPVAVASGPGAAAGRPVTQYYTVIAPGLAGFGAAGIAIVNPQQTAPTAATDTWPGQTKGAPGALSPSSFLQAVGGAVSLVSQAPGATSLRLSAGGQIAIENADLLTRQPKVFYATQAVIDEGNTRLAFQGSQFRLVPDLPGPAQQRITAGAHALLRVTPTDVTNGMAGLTMTATQPCDGLVSNVVGAANLAPWFQRPLGFPPHALYEYNVARQLLTPPLPAALDSSTPANLATTMRGIAMPWGTVTRMAAVPFTASLQQYGVNQFAKPEVGEAFVTSSLVAAVAGATVVPGGMPPTYANHYHLAGVNPQIVQHPRTWGSHWGGVVARDGDDVITLENYARSTEDAMAGADERYYFQMYNTDPAAPGSTWHAAWTSTPMQLIALAPAAIGIHAAATHEPVSPGARGFTNPITMRVTMPFDAVATARYGLAGARARISGAADASAQLREILLVLHVANTSIADHIVEPLAVRRDWEAALRQVPLSPYARQNAAAFDVALRQVLAMPTR